MESMEVRRQERRQEPRASLRLAISRMSVRDLVRELGGHLWTTNVSAGGMYMRCDSEIGAELSEGTEVTFEMVVPPGGGYSASAGTVRGAGTVIRIEQVEKSVTGLAVQFAKPLAIGQLGVWP